MNEISVCVFFFFFLFFFCFVLFLFFFFFFFFVHNPERAILYLQTLQMIQVSHSNGSQALVRSTLQEQ